MIRVYFCCIWQYYYSIIVALLDFDLRTNTDNVKRVCRV